MDNRIVRMLLYEDNAALITENESNLQNGSLDKCLKNSDVITPVRLPSWSQSANSFSGYPAIVSGFGLTVGGGSTASATLNYADVAIISNTVCSSTFPLNLRDSNICTSSTNGKSPCNGDSGGPLVILETDGLYTEVGIVSFGTRDCPVGSPAAFVRVTSFLDWISINTGLSIRA
uniref:Peptidase S1 domain-containing protein n=1 Tax=Timema monikensis TaxID=170555 RepID=A0A7R9HRI3_9NEOP|nr:unnamed protein product [Timema monikensis]